MKVKHIVSICLIVLIISTTMTVFATDEIYVWSNQSSTVSTSANLDNSNTEKTGNFLNLTCGSAILMEQNTGKILYEHNVHEKLKPASVTKIMSILLIMESLDSGKITLQDKVPCTEKAASMGGSQIWLDVREELTVDEMLKAICVVSAND